MTLKGSYSILTLVGVALVLSSASVSNNLHPSMAIVGTSDQKLETVKILMGSSVPNVQASTQAFYSPDILPNVSINTKVMWINEDESFHTVTSGKPTIGPNRDFDSGILSPKANWTNTFGIAGVYEYYCTVHPFMTGLVNVVG